MMPSNGCINTFVRDEQRPIAAWMRDVMTRRGISPTAWAVEAKAGRDTVSRAIREDYKFVTSTSTLHKLAKAIKEELPTTLASNAPFSVESLEQVVDALVRVVPGAEPMSEKTLRALALALRDTLAELTDDRDSAADPDRAGLIARTVVRQKMHPTVQ